MKLPTCTEHHVHEERLSAAGAVMPSEEEVSALARLYKVFGDKTRLRILFALLEGELCVCDIAELLTMTHSAISHQLIVLKEMCLVKFRRDGKEIFYSLDDDHIFEILEKGLSHIKE